MTQRSRGYAMTINNYTEEEYELLKNELHSNKVESYVIGREVGEKGTKHLQIYIYWKHGKTFNAMKKQFPRAHIEKARGNKQCNYDYCTKEGNFIAHNMETKVKIPIEARIQAEADKQYFDSKAEEERRWETIQWEKREIDEEYDGTTGDTDFSDDEEYE